MATGVARVTGDLDGEPFELRLEYVAPVDLLAAASSSGPIVVFEVTGTFGGFRMNARVNIPWQGSPWFTGTVGTFGIAGDVTEMNAPDESVTAPGLGSWRPAGRRTTATFTVTR